MPLLFPLLCIRGDWGVGDEISERLLNWDLPLPSIV